MRYPRSASAPLLLLVAACGGEEGTTISGEHVTAEICDNRFQYTEIRIPMGGSVNFVGVGRNPTMRWPPDLSWSTETVFGSREQPRG